ncbi:MAG: aminotransferase class I/II-fold pyridoxal phosphate-dependent enzyme [Cyanobacteria bacterium P01_D01_bin.73]
MTQTSDSKIQNSEIQPSRSLHWPTLAVNGGRSVDPATGAVTAPIHLSTTFERDRTGEYPRGYIYGRLDNPNRRALEEHLAKLEGGAGAIAFGSGAAAAMGILQTLQPGDRVIIAQDAYHGNHQILQRIGEPWGLEMVKVDATDIAVIAQAITPQTGLIWVETPSNPRLQITDLAAVADLAKSHEICTVCDNTWATPALQPPIVQGIDWVLHSTTKYIGGHGDVTGGAVVGAIADEKFARLREIQQTAGAIPSPFDCWLLSRSLQTLPVRMAAHCDHAMQVAKFLADHPAITQVHYPGLPSHPGHDIATRQMKQFGGMISAEVRGDRQTAMDVVGRCRLFTRATSLGSTESLIEHRASIEGPKTTTPETLLRISIGLEHPNDLIADLDQALHPNP